MINTVNTRNKLFQDCYYQMKQDLHNVTKRLIIKIFSDISLIEKSPEEYTVKSFVVVNKGRLELIDGKYYFTKQIKENFREYYKLYLAEQERTQPFYMVEGQIKHNIKVIESSINQQVEKYRNQMKMAKSINEFVEICKINNKTITEGLYLLIRGIDDNEDTLDNYITPKPVFEKELNTNNP